MVKQNPEGHIELMEEDGDTMHFTDPLSYAKYLCDKAHLTREQRAVVALIAEDMQQVYAQEVQRRDQLTDAQRRSEGLDATDIVRLPLVGRRLRLLFYGGGGCGKTRIITSVLTPLFRRFYGPKGLLD